MAEHKDLIMLGIQFLLFLGAVLGAAWKLSNQFRGVESQLEHVCKDVKRIEAAGKELAVEAKEDRKEHDVIWGKVRDMDKSLSVCQAKHSIEGGV